MPVERFFCPTYFSKEIPCILEDQEFHHLVNVIRCRVGDTVELVNGKNQLAQATLQTLEKKRAYLEIKTLIEKPSPPQLILAQGIPRFNRLEWIIEKGTELGATAFWLFPGEWSEKTTFSRSQMERMHHLTISAMKQCGRLDLPEIVLRPPLTTWSPQFPILFGDTRKEAPPITPHPFPLVALIGPERGLSPAELAHLEHLNAHGVRLNSNVLRTDTAALTMLSVLQAFNCK